MSEHIMLTEINGFKVLIPICFMKIALIHFDNVEKHTLIHYFVGQEEESIYVKESVEEIYKMLYAG